MLEIINEAKVRFPDSLNIERAAYNYKYKQEIVMNEKVFAED